jgi:ribose transport system substrate-binding protein
MGGKGSVLEIAGIPGIATDTLAWVGYDAVLELCPDITVAGEITGNFVAATAQAETVKFLATNPAGAGGVLQAGTMGYSALQAFEDSGIDPVPISDIGSGMGFINWAADHPDYPYIGSANPAEYMGKVNAEVGLRILAGEGPKVNLLVGKIEMFDASRVADLADPSAEAGALVVGDPASVSYPEGELDYYFTNPGLLK